MPKFTPNHECQFVVFKMLDPVAGDDERVRIAQTNRDEWDKDVIAYEHQRHRQIERCGTALDDREHARVLRFVDAHTASNQAPARERDVDHGDDQQHRNLRGMNLFAQDKSDCRRRGKSKQQGEEER